MRTTSNTSLFAKGELIGSGCNRSVYVSARNPNLVVKETLGRDNANEAAVWKNATRTLRKYLARVYAVSEDGTLMLMERTRPVDRNDLCNHLIPVAINHDAHEGNFGRLPDGRIVMHDYACSMGTTAKGTRSTPNCL